MVPPRRDVVSLTSVDNRIRHSANDGNAEALNSFALHVPAVTSCHVSRHVVVARRFDLFPYSSPRGEAAGPLERAEGLFANI